MKVGASNDDFVSGLPLTPTKKDSVWVIVDRLSKSAHFISVRTNYSLQKLAKLYIFEIVRLHGVLVLIISDRDPRFTSRFWKKVHETLGSRLDFKDKVRLIRDHLKVDSDKQKSYTGLKRHEIEYSVGHFIFLKVLPWKKVLKFGRKGKLSSRSIGPYHILKRVGPVAYQLELPPVLDRIHDVFHVSILKRYCSNPTHIVPVEEIEVRPDLTFEEEPIQILDRDVKVLRRKSIPLVKVL
ncbi:uncharacterized protein LOC105779033 [Gossypium raimondii]|uniref:uncharacterized protein LOC105779033 n=1 Tax=Gossypium raimondii TaxID=29730 RepID=UPI00063AF29E|nr:uncharacterized protein LOC105779033 [Gossypium raimondii]